MGDCTRTQTSNSKKNGCGVDAFHHADNADAMSDRTRMQTSNSKKNGCGVDAFPCANNADLMGDRTRMQTSNSKKTSNQIVRIFHLALIFRYRPFQVQFHQD